MCAAPRVAAALELLRPLYQDASAIDPTATTEKLHQNTCWQGRSGSVTHAISGIDLRRRLARQSSAHEGLAQVSKRK